MKRKSLNGRTYCLISALIIFGIYVLQRVLDIAATQTRELELAQAIIFTALVGVVYLLVTKSNEPFYGILTAMFGFRMMPPNINYLGVFSPAASMVYFIVKMAALVIFLVAIVRLYRQQEETGKIGPVPIVVTLAAVPFINHIQSVIGPFLEEQTGTMLYTYFSNFVLYTAAMIVLLLVAKYSNSQGAMLICDFQLVALLLNLGRRIVAVIINVMITNTHISRSYYCWIVIYAFFIFAFLYLRKSVNQINKKEA